MTDPPDDPMPMTAPAEGRPRPSIEERAARRAATHGEADGERYDRLLRHLQAGKEMGVERRTRFGLSWDAVHENFWKVVGAVAIGIAAYFVIFSVAAWYRDNQVDTWTGPAAVTSGQKLEGCVPVLVAPVHAAFPTWLRFDDRLFVKTDGVYPIGFEPDTAEYPLTGDRHDTLILHRIMTTDEGRSGENVLVQSEGSPTGRVYRHAAECD